MQPSRFLQHFLYISHIQRMSSACTLPPRLLHFLGTKHGKLLHCSAWSTYSEVTCLYICESKFAVWSGGLHCTNRGTASALVDGALSCTDSVFYNFSCCVKCPRQTVASGCKQIPVAVVEASLVGSCSAHRSHTLF